MAEKTQQKLYNFFIESGQVKRAEEIAKVYPQFKQSKSKSK